jgi:NADH-ubiquinone oxidoreductase chain 5
LFQNRLGDLFFVIFILLIFTTSLNSNIVLKSGFLVLILGACVKRAQFPFNAWLLAAIRAPTPISSLVHSSTLVVAGVYILLQYSYCLIERLNILKYLRVLTLIVRLFGLINEFDIKKLIAYSTIRHVGLILFLIRIQLYKITFFHLVVHAMFKSLIFMCFGFTILRSFHRQDKRLVSYINLSPIIKILYYYACFCLIGLPFLRGFFSKDFIVEKAMEINFEIRNIFLLLLFLSVRIYYSIKLLSLYSSMYVLNIVELQLSGIVGLLIILIVSVRIINVFIRIVFRVSLELLSYKIIIYLFILGFLILRVLTKLNFK